jgi:hypothetical protein
MFDALQNIKLIRIFIFATILLALSFYPPSEVTFGAGAKPSKFIIKTKTKRARKNFIFDLFNFFRGSKY